MAKTVIKVRKQLLWILDDEKLEDIKEVSRSRKSKMDNTMAKRKRTNNGSTFCLHCMYSGADPGGAPGARAP
jgi:hypothetical protein